MPAAAAPARPPARPPADSWEDGAAGGKAARPPRSERRQEASSLRRARPPARLVLPCETGEGFLPGYPPGCHEHGRGDGEAHGREAGTRAPPPTGRALRDQEHVALNFPVRPQLRRSEFLRSVKRRGARSTGPRWGLGRSRPPRAGLPLRLRGPGRARPYLFQVALAQARRCWVPRSSAAAAAGSLLPRSLRLGELMNFNLRRVLIVTPAARAAPTRVRRRALRHAPHRPRARAGAALSTRRKLGREQEAERPSGVPPRPHASAPGPAPAGPPG